jgi:hypothetical protein
MKLLLNESQSKDLIYSIKGDPNLLINKQVKVYYDITRHMFSVTFGGIVVLKADYVRLENVMIYHHPNQILLLNIILIWMIHL